MISVSSTGRLVVGASGSPGSLCALRYARDLAGRGDIAVVAIHAWIPPGGDVFERRCSSAGLRRVWAGVSARAGLVVCARSRALPCHRGRVRRGQRPPVLGGLARWAGGGFRARVVGLPSGDLAVTGKRILVAGGQPQIPGTLPASLRGAGYQVATAAPAEMALTVVAHQPPEAVILDLTLPGRTATEMCRELRNRSQVPLIVLSAVGQEHEKVAALDAGVDDYITTPVGTDELLARLRAVLRRVSPSPQPLVRVGELELDLDKRELWLASKPVQLTPHQFDLLRVLARHPGELLTHQMLLQQVWGPEYGSRSSLLRVHVARLRRKIEPDPTRPRYLLTQRGAGYRLVGPVTHSWPRPSRRTETPPITLPTERTVRHLLAIAPRPGDQRGTRPQQARGLAIVPQ